MPLAKKKSKRKKREPFVVAVVVMCAVLQAKNKGTISFDKIITDKAVPLQFDELGLQLYMQKQRQSLINESTVMRIGDAVTDALKPSAFFHDNFKGEMDTVMDAWKQQSSTLNASAKDEYLRILSDPTGGRDLLVGHACDVILAFRMAKGPMKRHVLISHINENWGMFSDVVPNRTIDWGRWESHWETRGCSVADLWGYLNHTNASAIFTTTHQWFDHPKVISVPLGINRQIPPDRFYDHSPPNRTTLLFMSMSQSLHRGSVAERIILNFNGTVQNNYKDGTDYWEKLQTSKFMLCPSGVGWDTYRLWESLLMGAIPVFETYYRQDGFYRTLNDLPVLLVDHFDNVTPTLLEEAYPKILQRAHEYKFEKLTNRWWVDLINSYRAS